MDALLAAARALLATAPAFDVGASGSAAGLLLAAIRAGQYQAPAWAAVQVPAIDLVFEVASDAIRAPVDGQPMRLPVSYLETIEACRALGDVIPPSKRLAEAIYQAAPIRTVFHSLVRTQEDAGERMRSVDFVRRFNADVDAQIAGRTGLTAGAPKMWLLHPRLAETHRVTGRPVAVNFGGWDAAGAPQQMVSGAHDVDHMDYSQLLQPLRRVAHRISSGAPIDLLGWVAAEEGVPERLLEAYR